MFDKRFLILLTGKSSTKVRYHEPLEFLFTDQIRRQWS